MSFKSWAKHEAERDNKMADAGDDDDDDAVERERERERESD